MMLDNLVTRHDDGQIAHLTLNAPATTNALSEAMMSALCERLKAISSDTSVRVVIVSGAGAHFCAGHNLKEMTEHRTDADGGRQYFKDLFDRCSEMMLSITRLPQPVIAQVQGIATAAGCQLVATCDLAIAATDATFATSGINIGLFCATPMVALSRNVSQKQALEMLLTGEVISADKALDIGLINRHVALESLSAATMELAETLASKSPVALRLGKKAFYDQATLTLEQAYAQTAQVMADNMMASDTKAGIDAFITKQPMPDWHGE